MNSKIGTKENPTTNHPEWQPYSSRGSSQDALPIAMQDL
jgi:hypothetical protein